MCEEGEVMCLEGESGGEVMCEEGESGGEVVCEEGLIEVK